MPDRSLDRDECLQFGPDGADCHGDVEYQTIGSSLKAWPRCAKHRDERQASYDDDRSMERYADSDVVPDWFDPTYAGERWEDD